MTGNTIGRKSFYLYLIVFLLSICLPDARATDKSKVNDIRYWSSPGYTRVVVELSQPVEYIKKRLSGPDRLYFDLRNSQIAKEIKTKLPVGDGILKFVRAGQFDPDTVRVVLDLETMEDFNVFILDDPTRLIIDVYAKRPEVVVSKRVVVLDPGHGGHDSGAVGPKGLYEKDVVLDIAFKVGEILSKDPTINVSLTRDKDVFLPLEERTAIAMSRGADLFVSIHANASPNRTARGIETYLLNWTNEEEAIRVSARENNISVKRMKQKMEEYKSRSELDMIKSSLIMQYNRDESVNLANYVHNSLFSDIAKVNKNAINLGVKQALFYVLVGATMPSILAEVSFISNPEEERLLSKESYRSMIANSIASGIKTYLSSASPQQKMAESWSNGPDKRRRLFQASAGQQ